MAFEAKGVSFLAEGSVECGWIIRSQHTEMLAAVGLMAVRTASVAHRAVVVRLVLQELSQAAQNARLRFLVLFMARHAQIQGLALEDRTEIGCMRIVAGQTGLPRSHDRVLHGRLLDDVGDGVMAIEA